tara:strand:+ start:588 stop:1412 length:825 start_codon:yes stop_codon:yes gene_type:complete
MKKYSDYCEGSQVKTESIHLSEYANKNIIVYGNDAMKNYIFTLNTIKYLSNSQLKYSRRIAIKYNGEDILFNISDIHFEVDFSLLGVNQYNVFLTLFHHIKENMIVDKKIFYIVCLNYQDIKLELMNIFYSFMNENKIRIVILTTQISFICDKIFQSSLIKKIKGETHHINCTQKEEIQKITNVIKQKDNISLFQLREHLYTFLTLNYRIHDCFAEIIFDLIECQYIREENIHLVLKRYNGFTKKYNNNYRPIYHMESFILFLINLKNKQENKS